MNRQVSKTPILLTGTHFTIGRGPNLMAHNLGSLKVAVPKVQQLETFLDQLGFEEKRKTWGTPSLSERFANVPQKHGLFSFDAEYRIPHGRDELKVCIQGGSSPGSKRTYNIDLKGVLSHESFPKERIPAILKKIQNTL